MRGPTNADMYYYTQIEAGQNITLDDLGNNTIRINSSVPDGGVTESKLSADSVTTTKIKNGAVTSDKLDSEVQQAIQKGVAASELNFIAGTNVDIDKSGNNITFSASLEAGSIGINDLNTELKDTINSKANKIEAGDNITISRGTGTDSADVINAAAYATGRTALSGSGINVSNLADGVYDIVAASTFGFGNKVITVPAGSILAVTSRAYTTGVILGSVSSVGRINGGIVFHNSDENPNQFVFKRFDELVSQSEVEALIGDFVSESEMESAISDALEDYKKKDLIQKQVAIQGLDTSDVYTATITGGPNVVLPTYTNEYGFIVDVTAVNSGKIEFDLDVDSESAVELNIENIIITTLEPDSTSQTSIEAEHVSDNHYTSHLPDASVPGGLLLRIALTNPVEDVVDINISNMKTYDSEDELVYDYSTGKQVHVPDSAEYERLFQYLAPNTWTFEDTTLADSTWEYDDTYEAYGFYYKADITMRGVTEDMLASVGYSVSDALSGLYSPFAEAGEDTVTIYAVTNANSITLQYIRAEVLE